MLNRPIPKTERAADSYQDGRAIILAVKFGEHIVEVFWLMSLAQIAAWRSGNKTKSERGAKDRHLAYRENVHSKEFTGAVID